MDINFTFREDGLTVVGDCVNKSSWLGADAQKQRAR
jgi:hypothetical protein